MNSGEKKWDEKIDNVIWNGNSNGQCETGWQRWETFQFLPIHLESGFLLSPLHNPYFYFTGRMVQFVVAHTEIVDCKFGEKSNRKHTDYL